MDAWYYRISVACDTMKFEFILLSPLLVWSIPLGLPKRRGICMHHHSTSGIRRRRRRRRHSTYWPMAQCEGVVWLLWWFALSEIWTTNIRSLGFQDIREQVILWRLILQSLKCIASMIKYSINIGYNISVCISPWVNVGGDPIQRGGCQGEAIFVYKLTSYSFNIWP